MSGMEGKGNGFEREVTSRWKSIEPRLIEVKVNRFFQANHACSTPLAQKTVKISYLCY